MDRKAHMVWLMMLLCIAVHAQKPFTEGSIVYRVRLTSPDKTAVTGTYTFTFKGNQIRKDLQLSNGYHNVLLLNCTTNTVYSLLDQEGKKYAIQLSMDDLVKAQQPFAGYDIKNEESNSKNIAGYAAYKGSLSYKNGAATDVYYTKDWQPVNAVAFERFPDARFLPLDHAYTDERGVTMQLEAEKITAGPVETGLFRIPPDHKMISYAEYRQLSK